VLLRDRVGLPLKDLKSNSDVHKESGILLKRCSYWGIVTDFSEAFAASFFGVLQELQPEDGNIKRL
jgi:hypothetical protein